MINREKDNPSLFHRKRMKDIQKIYDKCKGIMRENKIPIAKNIRENIEINKRLKRTLAECVIDDDEYVIYINGHILDSEDYVLEEILLHELIHTIDGCFSHNDKFKQYGDKLNKKYGYHIARLHSIDNIIYSGFDDSGLYTLVCPYCKRTHVMFRKPSANRLYYCTVCDVEMERESY
jgi:predicted metal-dependent hydrolase